MSTHAKHVFLSGPMGAGKSTVGPLLAERLGRAFVDLDQAVERETGLHVAEIFRSRGEATFRRLEADVVRRLVGHEEPGVFALGGGTVEDAETRGFLLDRGVLVTLTAPLDTLLTRAASDPASPRTRPLLGASPRDEAARAALSKILERRLDAYGEAHRVIDTAGTDADEVAAAIASGLARDERSIVVRLGRRSHRVVIAPGAATGLREELDALDASSVIVVTDTNVRPIAERWLAPITRRTVLVELAPGEAEKTLASIERIWDAALAARVDRRAVVVAVGGGVVGDMAGFAAATLLRGLRVVQVPTTLLAMVDSSVGGKTGIDRPQGKNLVGAFHQPSVVLCDVDALETLPPRELRAGWAEVVKTAWIEGEDDVRAIERDLDELVHDRGVASVEARVRAIRRAVRTKARIVAMDETESGARRWLNLGHTYGHAVEAASGYTLVHGEAVAIGLVAALRVSERLGHAQPTDVARMRSLLEALGLRTAWPDYGPAVLGGFLAADKKADAGSVRFVIAGPPGRVGVVAIEPSRLLALADLLSDA